MTRRDVLGAMAARAAAGEAIVDPHVHVFRRDPEFPYAEGRPVPPVDHPPEELLALMDANGVAKAVIVQVSHYMFDNRFLIAAVKRYPDRFVGVCRVDPQSAEAPERLEKLVADHGMQGLRLVPDAAGWFGDSDLMLPLWKRCERLRVAMGLLSRVEFLPQAARWIERCPELNVVVDHMADSPLDRPEELAKLLDLARYPRVFVKLSHLWSLSKQEYPWRDGHEQVKRVYDAFGPDRLMWASDWPVSLARSSYARTISAFREEMSFLNAEDRKWLFGGTARRVWRV